MPPSAISGTPVPSKSFGHIGNSGNLRNANTGNDTRRADGARADTDLDSVSAVVDESLEQQSPVAMLPPIT